MRRRFFTLDVFTNRRFAGNPLAVVLESDGLEAADMQAIAREFNLSETVFVVPPANPDHRARIRIFTPAAELPFAGHPTVGAAVLLGSIGAAGGAREMVIEEAIGLVRCHVARIDRDHGHARFAVPRLAQEDDGPVPDAAATASALGLEAAEIGAEPFALSRWSAGVPYVFVPVANRAAVDRCRPDVARWADAFGQNGRISVFVFCTETADPGSSFYARMFAPALGIPEDPATGSAVAALAGLVARSGRYPDGTHEVIVEQGYAMQRPSQIHLSVAIRDGALAAAAIGGDAVVVSEGTLSA
jgi:trans-2,3-dihydro-3-hydroxyanthranilate isomerase